MRIDAHHHFWRYSAAEYGWISDDMRILRRDFLPLNLETEIREAGIDGVVSVQARQTLEETRWLLSLSRHHDFIKGVVGWVPLTDPCVADHLEQLAGEGRLRAVRHLIQDEPDGYLQREDFNTGMGTLRGLGLTYDLLVRARQLPEAIRFVDRHPGQVFVVDHLAKPAIRANRLEPWRQDLKELARRENVYAKVSGLVTEADPGAWTEAQLSPYVAAALEAFGPDRLMFGTDWPVCLAACPYRQWHDIVCRLAESLSPAERASLFGGTAVRAYGLDVP
ncbi:MAG TPA: amidohydrolase family protein [Chthoniobacterales bacterium]